MVPYWEDVLGPELLAGLTPFVVAHGNSIRAMTKFLKHISDYDIVDLDIPTGWPRIVTLDDRLTLSRVATSVTPGGRCSGSGGGRSSGTGHPEVTAGAAAPDSVCRSREPSGREVAPGRDLAGTRPPCGEKPPGPARKSTY